MSSADEVSRVVRIEKVTTETVFPDRVAGGSIKTTTVAVAVLEQVLGQKPVWRRTVDRLPDQRSSAPI